jgi:hypothetical protein
MSWRPPSTGLSSSIQTATFSTYQNLLEVFTVKESKVVQDELQFAQRTFDSELALEVLRTKRLNRPLNRNRVSYYADLYKKGLWNEKTGEPLKYDKEGRLCDGQTRLAALAQCPDIEINFIEIWGLSDEAISFLDQGQARSQKQTAIIMGLDGVSDYTFATLKLMMINPQRRYLSRNWMTRPEQMVLFQEYQEALVFASRRLKYANVCYWRASVAKAYISCPPEQLEDRKVRLTEYLNILERGIPNNVKEDVAAILVRNLCLKATLRRPEKTELWRVIQKCEYGLNAFLDREEIPQLRVTQASLFPTPIDALVLA